MACRVSVFVAPAKAFNLQEHQGWFMVVYGGFVIFEMCFEWKIIALVNMKIHEVRISVVLDM